MDEISRSRRLEPSVTYTNGDENPGDRVPCPPVTLKGKIGTDGYLPENDASFDTLTEGRVGRDPMTIPPEVLTASGHPPTRTSRLVARLSATLEEPLSDGIREYRDLRRHCLACAANSAEVRRCAIINCPLWPYRMGRNPHNPKRGTNPFVEASRND